MNIIVKSLNDVTVNSSYSGNQLRILLIINLESVA